MNSKYKIQKYKSNSLNNVKDLHPQTSSYYWGSFVYSKKVRIIFFKSEEKEISPFEIFFQIKGNFALRDNFRVTKDKNTN